MSDVLDATEAARNIALRIFANNICTERDALWGVGAFCLGQGAVLPILNPPLPEADADGLWRYGDLVEWATAVYAQPQALQDETTTLYRHFDAAGHLLYVGVSVDVYMRTHQHNRSHWAAGVARIDVEEFPDRKSALSAEKKAIRTEHPLHNIRR